MIAFCLYFVSFFSLTSYANINRETEAFLTSRSRSYSESPLTKSNQDHFFYLKHKMSGQIELSTSSLNWVASPFFLISYSQRADQGTDPIVTPLLPPDRQVDLESHSDSSKRTNYFGDFQELSADYSINDYNFAIGRRILSLGNFKLFSIWNKFNPTALSLRPAWTTGVDQLHVGWQKNDTQITAYGIFDRQIEDRAQFITIEQFISPVQVGMLAGNWWYAHTLGLFTTIDISGWLVKFEALSLSYYGNENSRPKEIQAALGIEHGFAQNWSANFELLRQSQGAVNKDEYATFNKSPHQSFYGRDLGAFEIKWTPNPFYTVSAIAGQSLTDNSSIWGGTLTHQWNDNVEVSMGVIYPQGDGELGNDLQVFPAGHIAGVPRQFDVTLRAFF